MNKLKYLLKNVGILTISNFSSKILIFLLVPLYTRVLSTAEYGTYELATSTATLFYPILTLNIVDGVMRFSMDKTCEKKGIVSIGLKFLSISIITFGIGMYVLNVKKCWLDIHGLEVYVFLYYVSYVINQFLIQFAKGLERVKEMGVAGVVSTLAMVLANVLFLLVFKCGLVGFFLANILAQSVSSLYIIFRVQLLNYIEIKNVDKKLQSEMLVYSIPLIATAIGWWINSVADKYVVFYMISVSASGMLSVAYKIPQILNTFQGIFIQAWQISAIKEYGQHDIARFYGNTFTTINVLMCAACSWLILLTRPLAHVLYAKEFYDAWQFVPFLLLSSVFNGAAGLLGPILSAQKNSKAMMWSALMGAGANIIMNIVFVHYIGLQGATIATSICSYIIYVVRKQAVGKNIKIDRYVVILITWGLLCVQAWIESYLTSYIAEVAIMVVLLIINMKPLKQILLGGKELLQLVKNKNEKSTVM